MPSIEESAQTKREAMREEISAMSASTKVTNTKPQGIPNNGNANPGPTSWANNNDNGNLNVPNGHRNNNKMVSVMIMEGVPPRIAVINKEVIGIMIGSNVKIVKGGGHIRPQLLYNVLLPIKRYTGNITTKCHNESMSDNRDLTGTFHQKDFFTSCKHCIRF